MNKLKRVLARVSQVLMIAGVILCGITEYLELFRWLVLHREPHVWLPFIGFAMYCISGYIHQEMKPQSTFSKKTPP